MPASKLRNPHPLGQGGINTSYNDQEKNFMKQPVRVAITGAAGNIGYAIAFRIAYGDMLGPDQPVILHLLEITPALPALQGVVMELNDCAFPLLQNVVATDDVNVAFKDVNFALLVGARPRGPGMERKDLLTANGAIFGPQGRALNDHAARDVRVVVVGNPANTNSLIAACNAPDLDRRQFTAMTRLDHNRALSQLAEKTGSHVNDIKKMLIWGNHSSTQYPDIRFCSVKGRRRPDWWSRTGIATSSSPPCSSAARRSSRPGARPPPPPPAPPPSTICAVGRWAPRKAIG